MAAGMGAGAAGLALVPEVRLFAQQVQDFIEGPPVPDVKPEQLSPHVWMVYAKDGFPTQENQGLMASIIFVVTQKGVVVLDSGASLQIGQMAIRMIKTVTPKPVIAVFNSHYHGDHWLGNHAFVEAYGKDLPIHALAHTREQIAGHEGNLWRSLMERWTNQATLGTKVVAPNQTVEHGQVFDYGDVQISCISTARRTHAVGPVHRGGAGQADLCRRHRHGEPHRQHGRRLLSRAPSSTTMLKKAAGDQLWVPGHGRGSKDLLDTYGTFMKGIWEPCVQAVKDGIALDGAKALVMKDPRVASRAKTMAGFDSNIGKYTSLAYLEAEKEAF
jgi:hypothetical protein